MHCDIKFGAFMCNSENQGSLKSRHANLKQVCRKMINTLSLLVFATLTQAVVLNWLNWMQTQWSYRAGQARGPHRLRGSLSHLPFLSFTYPYIPWLGFIFLSLTYPSPSSTPFLPPLPLFHITSSSFTFHSVQLSSLARALYITFAAYIFPLLFYSFIFPSLPLNCFPFSLLFSFFYLIFLSLLPTLHKSTAFSTFSYY